MKQITLVLTVEEVKLLAALASDQLFRREFIDPKMPGYKSDPREVAAGKKLVAHLRGTIGLEHPRSPSSPVIVNRSGSQFAARTGGGRDTL